jgi:hypothetical protein
MISIVLMEDTCNRKKRARQKKGLDVVHYVAKRVLAI